MTYKENITAILECCFAGFKEEIIDSACNRILELEQRWIPVSERLPEEMGNYMVTIDYGKYGLFTAKRYYYGKAPKWMDDCVTAWMPMPEPYKAESEDKE